VTGPVAINTQVSENPALIGEIAAHCGSQAVIASIDVKKGLLEVQSVRTLGGRSNTRRDSVNWAVEIEKMGADEILLTSIDRQGTWEGFDLELAKRVTDAVTVPITAHGGARPWNISSNWSSKETPQRWR
jgi:imidazole glycerol-phosphate synthase subunit HisF